MRLAQGEIPLAQAVAGAQSGGQRFGAAILQLQQRLADEPLHGSGRNGAQAAIDGQNAPLLHPAGGDRAAASLLVPVHPAIEGEGRVGGDLLLTDQGWSCQTIESPPVSSHRRRVTLVRP